MSPVSWRCLNTESTSALFVKNGSQYALEPAKYLVSPLMLNFNPSAFGNDVLPGLVGVVVVTAEVVVELDLVDVADVVNVVVPLEMRG